MNGQPKSHKRLILVTGASGYIGGRLVPRLLESGYAVRCMVRDQDKVALRPWAKNPDVEFVVADAQEESALCVAMEGCEAAFYLIHSMVAAGKEYRNRDRKIAETFARAAAQQKLERIIYLGGLGETGDGLSEHLISRREVERALCSGPVPVTVFRAAMIIGSGSASFEILRYLVERLPVMVTPRWVQTESQPIAVSNVVYYLVKCLEIDDTIGATIDVGGPDVLTYAQIMQEMAKALGLKPRKVLPVPILTPWLSSWWIHLVTPVSAKVARPLAEGLKNRVVCGDDEAQRLMPQKLLHVHSAISESITALATRSVETSWLDAGPMPGDPDWSGGKICRDRRETTIDASPAKVYRALCRIGGKNGWYAANRLWALRGIIDRLLGGPGSRKWRKNPEELGYGETVDFWRVSDIEPGRRLQLSAEMKLPGIAQLEFEITPDDQGRTTLVQLARFKPRGLLGLMYWYSLLPLHGVVFHGMLTGIRRRAECSDVS